MARRYRYAFTRQKEAEKGKFSLFLLVSSLLFFVVGVIFSCVGKEEYHLIIGGMGLFGALLSVYGFLMGLAGFSEKDRTHLSSIIGSIANGILAVIWLAIYLSGL